LNSIFTNIPKYNILHRWPLASQFAGDDNEIRKQGAAA
jgi:hypothetical protein